VALGGVGTTPLALDISAGLARGINDDALEAVGRRVRAACTDVPSDLNATSDYRREMAVQYGQRAISSAGGRTASQSRSPRAASGPRVRKIAPGAIGGALRTAIELSVNGSDQRVEADNRMVLADLLRDVMGLTGTHIGCGTGSCGAARAR